MVMAKIAGTQVLVMFILMALGYICAKRKIITPQGANDINKLLIMLVSPAIIISSYNRPFDRILFNNLLRGFLLALISHLVAIAVAYAFIRGKGDKRKLERFACIFSNSGFMGFPLISAMLGKEGIIYATSYLAIFTLTQWTVGVLILAGKSDIKNTLRKLIINPGIISLVIGLSIFCFSIKLPSSVSSAIDFLADLNTPVAMMLVGTYIARSDFLKSFRNRRIYLVSALRLLLVPILMIPFYLLFKFPNELVIANFVAAACPVAALAAMFPALYGYDANYGSSFITVSTLLSVATIPLLVMLLSRIIGF